MKTNLPFWMSLRLSLHGRWVTKCFTVLLSAAALMLFAIASTAFTFDVSEFQVRGYQYYMTDKDYFKYYQWYRLCPRGSRAAVDGRGSRFY